MLAATLKALDRIVPLSFRMNTGLFHVDGRWIRTGKKGCADILTFARFMVDGCLLPVPVWIEVKRTGARKRGDRSEKHQAMFKAQVEAMGHFYILADSATDAVEQLLALKRPRRVA